MSGGWFVCTRTCRIFAGKEGIMGGLRVDVVDADEFVLDEDFAFFELWDWQVGFVL